MNSPRLAQRGFSLLEAVVAMVLIATTGMALFSWINTNLIALQRTQEANRRSEATQNALEYMATVNPMLKPEGNADLGNYSLEWVATPRSAPRDGTGALGGASLWQLAAYDTTVSVAFKEGATKFDFTLRQVGYKQVRSIWSGL